MEPWREELYHHGILGMHWGVRNGPPYPIGQGKYSDPNTSYVTTNKEAMSRSPYVHKDRLIKPGTTVCRVSTMDKEEPIKGKRKYLSVNENVDPLWANMFGKAWNDTELYEHKFTTTKPIKVASVKTLSTIYDEGAKDPEFLKLAFDAVTAHHQYVHYPTSGSLKDDFFMAMAVFRPATQMFQNVVKDLGYNAMADPSGISSGGLDSIILLDDSCVKLESIKRIKSGDR